MESFVPNQNFLNGLKKKKTFTKNLVTVLVKFPELISGLSGLKCSSSNLLKILHSISVLFSRHYNVLSQRVEEKNICGHHKLTSSLKKTELELKFL